MVISIDRRAPLVLSGSATASPRCTSSVAADADRRKHLQGQGRQRPARPRGGVRRLRGGEERLPARRRDRDPGSRAGAARPRGKRPEDQRVAQAGQEIVVQVIKDPLKSKGARLTMELTIAGRYMVYSPTGEGVGVSRARRQGARAAAPEVQRLELAGAARSSEPPRRGHPRGLRTRARVPLQAQRGAGKAGRGDRRRRSSSRRPTCGSASSATSSGRLRARDRRRPQAAASPGLVLLADRAELVDRVEVRKETRSLFEAYGVDRDRGHDARRVDLATGGYLMIDTPRR